MGVYSCRHCLSDTENEDEDCGCMTEHEKVVSCDCGYLTSFEFTGMKKEFKCPECKKKQTIYGDD